ncbi:ABC transporter permease subunit [Spiroplasma endosymbiont of Anurida maritima]|uniref:hypothetical protein n=1 Tax=Spiroplasma endosymbiont of Anurida maritima TaxID=2967972 RepID=UPI0036D40B0F
MKMLNFLPSRIVINNHLKGSWKIILSFALVFLILATGIFLLLGENTDIHSIAPGFGEKPDPEFGKDYLNFSELGTYFGWFAFGGPTIIFIMLSVLPLIHIFITKEIKEGKIGIWFSSYLSRHQIIFSKIIFVIISSFIIMAPSILSAFIFSAISIDAYLNMGAVILQAFYFILTTTALVSLMCLISAFFANKGKGVLGTTISSIVIAYMMAIFGAYLFLANAGYINEAKILNYFSIYSLMPNTLIFQEGFEGINRPGFPEDVTFYLGIRKPNLVWEIVSPILSVGIITGSISLTSVWFNKVDIAA